MHPHGANRHTLEIAESRTDARIEARRQPKIGAEAKSELEMRRGAAAGNQESSGLHIWDDADLRVPRIDAPTKRETHRDDQRRVAADKLSADAEDQRAVERKVLGMGHDTLARFRTHEQHRIGAATRREDATAETDVEFSARPPIGAFECRAAAVGKAQHQPDLRTAERAVGRVIARHSGRLCRRLGHEPCANDQQTQHASQTHDRLLEIWCEGYPTNRAAFRCSGTPPSSRGAACCAPTTSARVKCRPCRRSRSSWDRYWRYPTATGTRAHSARQRFRTASASRPRRGAGPPYHYRSRRPPGPVQRRRQNTSHGDDHRVYSRTAR